jgi:hypothetical protein
MAVVAGVVFFAVRALLALIPGLAAGFAIEKWSRPPRQQRRRLAVDLKVRTGSTVGRRSIRSSSTSRAVEADAADACGAVGEMSHAESENKWLPLNGSTNQTHPGSPLT